MCLLILKNSYGQTTTADTSNLQLAAINNARDYFNKAIGVQSSLYNGPAYYFYNPTKISGSAYYQEKTNEYGSVLYDGFTFKNVQLVYDVYKDELITLLYDKNSYFFLLKQSVQNFDLLNHHFINIDADTLKNNSVIKSGYYDELYNGRVQVLGKITKVVKENNSSTGTIEAFSSFGDATEDFFVRKNDIYYKINSQGGLLDVLKDKKKQLQQFVKSGKIKFNRDPGQAMTSIAAYYDSLTN